jgi:hypothetical protein
MFRARWSSTSAHLGVEPRVRLLYAAAAAHRSHHEQATRLDQAIQRGVHDSAACLTSIPGTETVGLNATDQARRARILPSPLPLFELARLVFLNQSCQFFVPGVVLRRAQLVAAQLVLPCQRQEASKFPFLTDGDLQVAVVSA